MTTEHRTGTVDPENTVANHIVDWFEMGSESDEGFLAMMVLSTISLLLTAGIIYFRDAMPGVFKPIMLVLPLTGLFGALAAMFWAFTFLVIPISILAALQFPITTAGTFHYVTKGGQGDIDECLNCGVKSTDGVITTFGSAVVAFGIVLWTTVEGTHYDCTPCANDPVEAALRAQAGGEWRDGDTERRSKDWYGPQKITTRFEPGWVLTELVNNDN